MADESVEESPAQRSARLRREKREKRILGEGSDRLSRITNVSGRKEDFQPGGPKPNVADDPAEVDISRLPASINAPPAADEFASATGVEDPELARLRAAFREQAAAAGGVDPATAGDPMMQLMQQMSQMLGMPPPSGAEGSSPFGGGGAAGASGSELPPALAAMLSGQGMPPGQQAAGGNAAAGPTNGYIWRIIHALFSLSLGLYIAATLPFTGSKSDRLDISGGPAQGIFWIFATVELGLQSTRYLLERGNPQQGGMLVTVSGFLPEPYKSYVLLVNRYARIWTTLSEDALVTIFVLGVVVWWKNDLQ